MELPRQSGEKTVDITAFHATRFSLPRALQGDACLTEKKPVDPCVFGQTESIDPFFRGRHYSFCGAAPQFFMIVRIFFPFSWL